MNPLTLVYHEALFRPLLNLLVGLTNVLPSHNVGLAIILVTVVVRLILLPPALAQARHARDQQAKMRDVQGKVKHIKERFKHDKAKQAEATMTLYRQAGINPAAGCLPLLIQLPILLALYRVFLVGLNQESFQALYSFVPAPDQLATSFVGISLTTPSLLLGVIAGLAQLILMRFLTGQPVKPSMADDQSAQMMASMQRNMTYIFPVMTVFIALQLPAALPLYWVASTVLAMGQQYLIKKWLRVDNLVPMV